MSRNARAKMGAEGEKHSTVPGILKTMTDTFPKQHIHSISLFIQDTNRHGELEWAQGNL